MLSNVLKCVVLLNILANIVNSDLCQTDRVDNAYTKMIYHRPGSGWYSEITFIENGKQYVLNTRSYGKIGKPIKESTKLRRLTRVQILDHQQSNCSEEDIQCREIKKIIDKSIVFFNSTNRYLYLYYKVIHDNDIELFKYELPWNQSGSGDPTNSSKFNLWPNEWITQLHPCVAYDYWSKELIYIMNANNDSNTTQLFKVALNPYKYPFNESVEFTQQPLNFSHQFVGLFNYANGTEEKKIFAITSDQRLFELKESNVFEESTLNFKDLIGCVAQKQSDNWTLVIITVAVIALLVIFVIILLALVYKKVHFPSYNKTPRTAPSSTSTGATDRQTEVASIVTIDSTTGKPLAKEERAIK